MARMPSFNSLYDETCTLLRQASRKLPYAQIASETGLSASWVSAFARNEIPDPGVHKVQRLHDFLIAKRHRAEVSYYYKDIGFQLPHTLGPCVYIIQGYSPAQNKMTYLYVGCTNNIRQRLENHNLWPEFLKHKIHLVTVRYFEDSNDAAKCERMLISSFQPLLNKLSLDAKTINKIQTDDDLPSGDLYEV